MGYKVTPDLKQIRLNETDEIVSILQNVAIILSTVKGTCPLYRQFGISAEYVDKPIPVAQVVMYADIKEAIEEYEPRVEVTGIDFAVSASEPGKLIPTVTVEVIHNE